MKGGKIMPEAVKPKLRDFIDSEIIKSGKLVRDNPNNEIARSYYNSILKIKEICEQRNKF